MGHSKVLTSQSPLMQLVTWMAEEYFTAQFFHQQYIADSPHGGKYRRFDSFMRVIRNIPAYAKFEHAHAIVELRWAAIKQDEPQLCGSFQSLFQAAGWNPITLLNATAQAELAHHLDNELNQQMAVASSTMVARHIPRKSGVPLPEETAVRVLDAYLQLGRLLKTPEHIVQQEAARQIEATTGVNLRPLLLAAPAQSVIAPDEEMLEPRDLAKKLGLSSAITLNRALEQLGWQVKQIDGDWQPTPLGAPFASRHAWTADHGAKHGYNWRWRCAAVTDALHSNGLLSPNTQQTQSPSI